MSGDARRRGWNDEQRKTLARGGEALKNVGKLAGAWLFGNARQAHKTERAVVEGLQEKLEELEAVDRRQNAITVGGEPIDEEFDADDGEDLAAVNRIECIDCQTTVGSTCPTATLDPQAVQRFAREHAGHNLNLVRPKKVP